MIDLQNDIINYLKQYFANDDIFNGLSIVESNSNTNVLEKEQITISIGNTYEEVQFSTFDNAEIENVSVQLNCYGKGKRINDKGFSPLYMSQLLCDKVSKAFDKVKMRKFNDNIKGLRKVGSTISLPLKDGSQVYVTSLRYELLVNYDYVKNQNQENKE